MLSCKNCNYNNRFFDDKLISGVPDDRIIYQCTSDKSPAYYTVVEYKNHPTHKENTTGLTTFMCNAHSSFEKEVTGNTCKSCKFNTRLSEDTPNYCTAIDKPCFDSDKLSLMLDYFWCNRYEQGQEE